MHILVNDLPISDIELPSCTISKDNCKFISQELNKADLEQAQTKYINIVDYLEKNKLKTSTERKIDIFQVWFYWLSVSNFHTWRIVRNLPTLSDTEPILKNTNMCSFRLLHTIAKSVIYEVKSLNCCYIDTQIKLNKANFDNHLSLYKELALEHDILTRCICSQSLDNVKLLIDNGFDVKTIKYENKKLKTPLHTAFYCDNLPIFNFLLNNGCEIGNDDIFYDFNFKKNFKFALYLYLYREKIRINNQNLYLYELIEFDYSGFILNFSLYEHFNEAEIIRLYETLFEIGFSLNETSEVYNKFDLKNHTGMEEIKLYKFTQLLNCICQKHITHNAINYLVSKFLEQNSMDVLQEELAKIIRQCTFYYQILNGDENCDKLRSKDLLVILGALFPKLNNKSMLDLKYLINFSIDDFMDCHFKSYSYFYNYETKSDSNFNVFYKNSFKIIEYFIKYDIFNHNVYFKILYSLVSSYTNSDDNSFESFVKNFCLFIDYFLQNRFLTRNDVLCWLFSEISIKWKFTENEYNMLCKNIKIVCDTRGKNPFSLFNLARFSIKHSVNITSDQNISKFNLPGYLKKSLMDTIKNEQGYLINLLDFS